MNFSLPLKDEPQVQKQHCCESMTHQANMHYPKAPSRLLGSTDKRIYWSPVFEEYGLICQPSAELLLISHCPFCGANLPASKRNSWFSALEAMGWKTWEDPIPEMMLQENWEAQ